MRRMILAAIVVALMQAVGAPGSAWADSTMVWKFRSDHSNIVDVELYSQDADHVWPGGDKVYSLNDDKVRDIAISCRDGEKICYGAWVRGQASTYWGTGPQNKRRCDDCCSVCGDGDPPVRILR